MADRNVDWGHCRVVDFMEAEKEMNWIKRNPGKSLLVVFLIALVFIIGIRKAG
jgi:hypothetical protein